jgi:hypothetical protein
LAFPGSGRREPLLSFFQMRMALAGWYAEAWKLDHGVEGEELLLPVKKFTNAIQKLKSAMAAQRQEKGSTYENSKKHSPRSAT